MFLAWLNKSTARGPRGTKRTPRRSRGGARLGRQLLLEGLESRALLSITIQHDYVTGLGIDSDHLGPDAQGAAGPSAFITTVNANFEAGDTDPAIALFPNKTTNANAIQDTMLGFWVTQGGLPRASPNQPDRSLFNQPTVVWYESINRFVVLVTDTSDPSFSAPRQVWNVAVSKTANPTTLTASDWNYYQILNTEWNNSSLFGPASSGVGHCGYNSDAFVFIAPSGTSGRLEVVSIDSRDMVNGVAQADLRSYHNAIGAFSAQPTKMHGSAPGDPMWIVTEANDGDKSIAVAKMTGVLTSNADFEQTNVAVNPYFGTLSSPPRQPDGTTTEGFEATVITSAAEANGLIVATHTVGIQAPGRTLIRWYVFDVNSGTPTLNQQGDVSDAATGAGQANFYDYYPSIDVNASGDIGLTYVQSGTAPGEFLSMWVTGRSASDPANTMQTPVRAPSATGLALTTAGSHGRMSSVSVDPDGSFWATNEFIDLTGRSSTAVVHFRPGSGTEIVGNWIPVGPAPILGGQTPGSLPVTGRITGIAADPLDANTIFVSAASGGVWRTTDHGANWTALTDYITDKTGNPVPLFVGAIAETRDQNNNQIVYAGTGEANNTPDNFYGVGILVSFNGGSTWTLQDNEGRFKGATVSKIAIDPADKSGKTVYVAINNNGANRPLNPATNLPRNVTTGVYKSIDGGATWRNATGDDGETEVANWSDVVINPRNPTGDPNKSTIFAAVGSHLGSGDNGVRWSRDGGQTWEPLSGIPVGASTGRFSLAAYDDGVTQEVFVSIAKPTAPHGLFKMLKVTVTDAGVGTTDLTANVLSTSDYLGRQGHYDSSIAISPRDPNYIFAGGAPTTGLFSDFTGLLGSPVQSFDGGLTWSDISKDTLVFGKGPHPDSHAVAFDANGNLIEGDDGGVFMLSNPTNSSTQRWSSLNGNLQITQFTGIVIDPTVANVAYGGSQDNGTEKYTGALAWQWIAGGDGGLARIDPTDHNVVYQTAQNRINQTEKVIRINVSTDAGASFSSISDGIMGNAIKFYAPYEIDSNGAIYFGTDHLNFSNDRGANWIQIGTSGTVFNPGQFPIDTIELTSDNKVIYVVAGGSMFVSAPAAGVPNGLTWSQVANPPRFVSALNGMVADPTHPYAAYAVVSTFTGSSAGHVFKTTDFGATWTDISGNLPDVPVHSIDVSADGSTLYIGTDVGVYSSDNAGGPDMPTTPTATQWARFGAGLPNVQVVEIDVVPSQNLIAAATHGRGLWIFKDDAGGLAPTITSTNNATFTLGAVPVRSFSFTATGIPKPALTLSGGSLPSGVTFDPGSGTLSGAPAGGSVGNYSFTITASNGVAPDAQQTFTLTVRSRNQTYVASVYDDVLGRAADPAGLAYWTGQLDNDPAQRPNVAAMLVHSDEYFGNRIVSPAYQRFLGRSPDAEGIAYWVDQLRNHGLTDERLEASFIASPEYYQRAGGSDNQWIDAMYMDLLGRAADAEGQAHWAAQLAQGVSRADVAYGIAAGLERERQLITDVYYMDYLGRGPDQQGLDYWVDRFAKGETNENLITGFVGSDEYYNKYIN